MITADAGVKELRQYRSNKTLRVKELRQYRSNKNAER